MSRPTLPTDASVDIWRIDLAAPADTGLLAADELERAARFRFARDRRRFVAARAGLRRLLAAYLGREPAALRFSYGPNGKPSLAGADIFFNLSHAEEWALIALTRLGEIGVDIEFVRPVALELADRYFAPAEAAALRAFPPPDRPAAFFRCWTRKEAYLKARGGGVLLPLDGFAVSLDARAPALLSVAGAPDEARQWQLAHLEPAPGYVAAVALRAARWRLRDLGAF